MNVLVGALVLFLLGLLGARFSFTWAHTPLGPRTFLMAGTHFLLVGVILGSGPVGLLTPTVLQPLYPLLALGVGWIGLLYGMQLDWRHLRDVPTAVIRLALLQAAFAFLLFAVAAYALLRVGGPLPRPTRAALFTAAAMACISSPLGIAVVANLTRLRGRLSELLLFVASLDALVGILAVQLIYTVFQPLELRGQLLPWRGLEGFVLAGGLGITFGIIFLWLTRSRPARAELSLFLMGTSVFLAGAALYLGVSALFVAVTAGVVIANFSPMQARVFRSLHQWEQPLYVILMVVMGSMLHFDRWLILPLAAAYAILRLLAKLAGGWLAARSLPAGQRPPPAFGLALAAQSGMPLALLLSVTMNYGALQLDPPPALRLMVGSVVLAILVSELTGPFLTRSVLARAGERVGPVIAPEPRHA